MNYELAKQLKICGFKQANWDELRCQHRKPQSAEEDVWHRLKDDCEVVCIPTLSELIEACGTMQLNNYKEAKYAQALSEGETGEGSTPTEAVAKLWLKLNE